tara:strand:- start:326 stop:463 length:138 start_codon:yes stop_codon:yes gene_type:complete
VDPLVTAGVGVTPRALMVALESLNSEAAARKQIFTGSAIQALKFK